MQKVEINLELLKNLYHWAMMGMEEAYGWNESECREAERIEREAAAIMQAAGVKMEERHGIMQIVEN